MLQRTLEFVGVCNIGIDWSASIAEHDAACGFLFRAAGDQSANINAAWSLRCSLRQRFIFELSHQPLQIIHRLPNRRHHVSTETGVVAEAGSVM